MKDKTKEQLKWALVAGVGMLAARKLLRRHPQFVGKNVLVAGGTRGLGLVLAREAMARGANVSICGRDAQTLKQALVELQGLGKVHGAVCNLTRESDVKQWVEEARRELGSVDVLIYNAGIIQVGPYEAMRKIDFKNAIDTHVYGALHTINQVVPLMKDQGGGNIALIASMGGKRAVPHMLPYDVSKFALVGMGEGMAVELAKDKIYVTTVCPATMRTGSPDHAYFKGDHRKEYTWFSLLDSLPGVSVSAEYAANKILDAIGRRQVLLVYPFSAQVGVALSALAPSVYVKAMRLVSRLLPQSDDARSFTGEQSHSKLSPSALTALTQKAAEKNNEVRGKH